MSLAVFEEALDQLVDTGASSYGDGESLVTLERLASRLECFIDKAAASFDQSGAYGLDGARSAPAWIATRCRLPLRTTKAQVRRGKALRELPVAEAAFAAGAISSSHVSALAGLLKGATHDAVVEKEGLLVGQASELRFSQFKSALSYFAQLADEDGTEARAKALSARRGVYLVQGYEGAYTGGIALDPIAGAIVSGELQRLEQVLFEQDTAEAERGLSGAGTGEAPRSATQRRADALVEMARRSAACPDDARMSAPLVTVLVGYETLHGRICELANGTVVSPGSLLAYLDQALVERAVFKTPTRVEVSAKARLFSGATRRAIELRDRRCQHPFCELRAERCEVDHILPAAQGGSTTQENGRLLCGFHNRLRNQIPDLPVLPEVPKHHLGPPGREGLGARLRGQGQ